MADRHIPLADADLQSLIYDSLTPCLALMHYISISANEATALFILASCTKVFTICCKFSFVLNPQSFRPLKPTQHFTVRH